MNYAQTAAFIGKFPQHQLIQTILELEHVKFKEDSQMVKMACLTGRKCGEKKGKNIDSCAIHV